MLAFSCEASSVVVALACLVAALVPVFIVECVIFGSSPSSGLGIVSVLAFAFLVDLAVAVLAVLRMFVVFLLDFLFAFLFSLF